MTREIITGYRGHNDYIYRKCTLVDDEREMILDYTDNIMDGYMAIAEETNDVWFSHNKDETPDYDFYRAMIYDETGSYYGDKYYAIYHGHEDYDEDR